MTLCSTPDCARPARSRGLCSAHRQQARRDGVEPAAPPRRVVVGEATVGLDAELLAALEAEQKRTGESRRALMLRWLRESAARAQR